ncbi:MAG: hypothetical protein M3252_01720 [Actinomycetota bacterium]|nr:hypothetical protein [Actinomycetota bacterium]
MKEALTDRGLEGVARVTDRAPVRFQQRIGAVVAKAVCFILAAVMVSCQPAASSQAPLPNRPPEVTVTLREYSFEFDRPVPAGRVLFRVVNSGTLTHEPELLLLPEDLPPLDQQLRGDRRVVIAPFAAVPARDPGQVGTFAVDLQLGLRFGFVCFARDPDDDQSHAQQGMSFEFRPSLPE